MLKVYDENLMSKLKVWGYSKDMISPLPDFDKHWSDLWKDWKPLGIDDPNKRDQPYPASIISDNVPDNANVIMLFKHVGNTITPYKAFVSDDAKGYHVDIADRNRRNFIKLDDLD